MGNLERPLTWILVIGLLGYLFVVNCTCGEEIPQTSWAPMPTYIQKEEVTIEDSNTTVVEKTELITKEE